MPYILNPERGYIATANQPVVEPGSLPLIGIDAAYGHRAARIEQMIEDRAAPLDVAATAEMQMDNQDGGAIDLVPHLLQVPSGDARVIEVQGLIERWSQGLRAYQASPGSAGAAAYAATWRQVLALTFHDDLPEDYWPGGGGRWFEVVANLLGDYEDPFWDDRSSTTVETAPQILELAMARTTAAAARGHRMAASARASSSTHRIVCTSRPATATGARRRRIRSRTSARSCA
jgi:penicillin amidase